MKNGMSNLKRMRGWAPVALLLVLLLVISVWYFFYTQAEARKLLSKWEQRQNRDWGAIASYSLNLVTALTKFEGVSDFSSIGRVASAFEGKVEKASDNLQRCIVPSECKHEAEIEKRALQSLREYLELLASISYQGKDRFEQDKGILDDRARRANENVNDFIATAKLEGIVFSADIYQAGEIISKSLYPQENDETREAVYQTVLKFMNADINEKNFDLIWEMLSSLKKRITDIFGLPREKFPEVWMEAWGKERPTSFYVSRASINFPDSQTAEVKVIAYYEKKKTQVKVVRLIKEGDSWKIDGYPFVGWL